MKNVNPIFHPSPELLPDHGIDFSLSEQLTIKPHGGSSRDSFGIGAFSPTATHSIRPRRCSSNLVYKSLAPCAMCWDAALLLVPITEINTEMCVRRHLCSVTLGWANLWNKSADGLTSCSLTQFSLLKQCLSPN